MFKLTINVAEQCQWRPSDTFIVNFEHISNLFLEFLLLFLSFLLIWLGCTEKNFKKVKKFYRALKCLARLATAQKSVISAVKSPETMRKLCLSTKFPHQEIR